MCDIVIIVQCTHCYGYPSSHKVGRLASPLYVSPGHAQSITVKAQSTPFPWSSAVPNRIAEWFESYTKSRSTRPEFVFTTAITTLAAIIGPRMFVRLREEYPESVIMAEPGAGISQAFRLAVIDPLKSMDGCMDSILVDNFTTEVCLSISNEMVVRIFWRTRSGPSPLTRWCRSVSWREQGNSKYSVNYNMIPVIGRVLLACTCTNM